MPRCTRTGSPPPRAITSARSLAAVVARSSMIAVATMSSPGIKAVPTSLIRSPARTGLPRPGPSTKEAMVAIDRAAMVVWLSPTMIVRFAMGIWILRSCCARVWPRDCPTSSIVGGTERMPWAAMRMRGGAAYSTVATTAEADPIPKNRTIGRR